MLTLASERSVGSWESGSSGDGGSGDGGSRDGGSGDGGSGDSGSGDIGALAVALKLPGSLENKTSTSRCTLLTGSIPQYGFV